MVWTSVQQLRSESLFGSSVKSPPLITEDYEGWKSSATSVQAKREVDENLESVPVVEVLDAREGVVHPAGVTAMGTRENAAGFGLRECPVHVARNRYNI